MQNAAKLQLLQERRERHSRLRKEHPCPICSMRRPLREERLYNAVPVLSKMNVLIFTSKSFLVVGAQHSQAPCSNVDYKSQACMAAPNRELIIMSISSQAFDDSNMSDFTILA